MGRSLLSRCNQRPRRRPGDNTPIVAVFLPVIKDWTRRTGVDGSLFYLPLSYAAVLGGVTTLIGTSTTLVVQSALLAADDPPLSMFTISRIGVPVAVLGLAYLIVASRYLLPKRTPAEERLLDPRNYTAEMEVVAGGPIDGASVEAAGLRGLPHLYVAQVLRAELPLATTGPDLVLVGGDRLVFVGRVEAVVELTTVAGLSAVAAPKFQLSRGQAQSRFVEAVISNTSPIVGQSVRESDFRTLYGATIFALHRNGELIRGRIGDVVLRPGDTLLLQTDEQFVEAQRNRRDFLLVANLDGIEPPVRARAPRALAIFGLCVLGFMLDSVLHLGVLPVALIAASLMVLTGCCTMEQARRSIDWPVLLSIGASLGVGKALESTGAAAMIADTALRAVSGLGVYGTLGVIYLMTVVLTELITNNAAAAIAFPIARAAALHAGIDILPVAVCVAMAASCGFATPLGYQTHMMVYGAGGYRFTDFARMGVGLDLLCMVTTVGLLPWLFGLT